MKFSLLINMKMQILCSSMFRKKEFEIVHNLRFIIVGLFSCSAELSTEKKVLKPRGLHELGAREVCALWSWPLYLFLHRRKCKKIM